ncbi:conserved hypothetical protein [uncultured Desulfatiglans sp.]|nr:conserved hypothetical protein [uncultured Desulfatiglans sp.]
MEKWKTIEPGVWKPIKAGDYIIGILVNKEPKDETSGLSARYYLENDEGMFFVWGCAVLDDRMQYAKVGGKVRITYEGVTANKRNQKVNLYRVDVAETRQSEQSSGAADIKDEDEAVELEKIEDAV